MALLSTSGLEELLGDMESIAELPDDTILEMLSAEADIVAKAQESEANAMLSGSYSKGTTAHSITYEKKLETSGSDKCLYVYPKGNRSDGNKRSVSEVAFINEFGKKGQAARPFINAANEKSADSATEAAARVYDEFLKSKNL